MNNYAMIYHDSYCTTLQEGLRILNQIPNPILSYCQIISLSNLQRDIKYKPYINHDPVHEIIKLTFPPEITWIANIHNTHHCKMVSYYKDNSYIKEISINPSTNIKIGPDTNIIIYTKGQKDVNITFNVYLMKTNNSKTITSKL